MKSRLVKLYSGLRNIDKRKLSFLTAIIAVIAILSLPAMAEPVAKILNLPSSINQRGSKQLTVELIIPNQEYLQNFNPYEITKIYLLDNNIPVAESSGNIVVELNYTTYSYSYGYGYSPVWGSSGYWYGYGYGYGYGYYGYSSIGIHSIKFIATFVFTASPNTYNINKVKLCKRGDQCLVVKVQKSSRILIYTVSSGGTIISPEMSNNMTTTTYASMITKKPEEIKELQSRLGCTVTNIETEVYTKNYINTRIEFRYDLKRELSEIMGKTVEIAPVLVKEVRAYAIEVNINGTVKPAVYVIKKVEKRKIYEYVPKELAQNASMIRIVVGKLDRVVINDPVLEITTDNNTIAYLIIGTNNTSKVLETASFEVVEAQPTTTQEIITPTTPTTKQPAQPTKEVITPTKTTTPITSKVTSKAPSKPEQKQPQLNVYYIAAGIIIAIIAVLVVILWRKGFFAK